MCVCYQSTEYILDCILHSDDEDEHDPRRWNRIVLVIVHVDMHACMRLSNAVTHPPLYEDENDANDFYAKSGIKLE